MRRGGWVGLCLVLAACPKSREKAAEAEGVDAGPASLAEAEPNERPEQALAVPGDSTITASLSVDPSKADEDWYRLAPPASRLADLRLSGIPGSDVMLEVHDRDRNRLTAVNSAGEGQPERHPNLFVEGERWVRVAPARKGGGGAYTLEVRYREASDGEEREPNDRAADAHPLSLGQAVTAFVGHAGDEDWYRVELGAAADPGVPAPPAPPSLPSAAPPVLGAEAAAAPEAAADAGTADAVEQEPPSLALKIDLTGLPGVRPELQVLSAAQAPLFTVRSKEDEPLSLRNVGVRATDQVVYVVVKSSWPGSGKDAKRTFNAEAPYTLSVAVEEAGANAELEPNDELLKATALPAKGFKEGFLSPKTDVDHYVLKTSEPLLVRAELSGVERLDLALSVLEAPEGEGTAATVTLKANDGVVKEPEQLNNVFCNGLCYFRVEGAQRKVEGKWVRDYENAQAPYRLTLTAVPDTGAEEREGNNTVDDATPLVLGRPLRGTVHPKRDVDYYVLDLSDRPVRTSIKATLLGILKVDVGLYLHRLGEEDRKLELVQTSDRAKGEQPESIRYSAEPGIYVLEVRDAKNREANFQDAYQLTVEEG